MKTLVDAAVEGRLETGGDVEKFQGDYARIVKGVNTTIEKLVGHVDAIPSPTMIIDKDFSVRYLSQAGCEAVGMSQQQVLGQKCYNLSKTSDCRTANCACAKTMHTGRPETSETDAHPSGTDLEISHTGTPIRDQQGEIIGALEIVTDQTQVKRAQAVAEKVADYQKQEVNKLSDTLGKVAQGELNAGYTIADSDEDTAGVAELFGSVSEATNATVQSMADTDRVVKKVADYQEEEVQKLSNTLSNVPEGDLTVAYSVAEADEDTEVVAQAFDGIAKALNTTIKSLSEARKRTRH